MMLIFLFTCQFLLTLSSCPYDSTGTACNMPKYMVDSLVCADVCPTLFSPYQLNCPSCRNYCSKPAGVASILFTLELASVQDLTLTYVADSSDSTKKFINPGGIPYKSLTKNSPLPTLDRGFYFATTSSMSGNQSYIPGLYFILNLVIKPLGSGEVLNVRIGSTTYMRLWVDPSGVYHFSALIYDSNGAQVLAPAACTVDYSSSWQTFSVYLYQSTCSTASLAFYYNGAIRGLTSLANEIRFPSGIYTWTFGNAGGANSFKGFIYWLQARAEILAVYDKAIPIDCADNSYWDRSACHSCNVGCQTWPWCVRGGDCSYCYLTDCSACNGYDLKMCSACYTGIPPGCCDHLGKTCTQTWSNTACKTGYFLIGGVCLYGCPYGFGNCTAVTSAVIAASFAGTFAGSYGSAWTTGMDSNNYNYWNSPEIFDPFPARSRGLYFNSSQFLSGKINFSHTWSLGMWVYAISGTIMSHSSNAFTISSDGSIIFNLEKWDGSHGNCSAPNSMALNTWSYISYIVEFSNKATKLTPYLNSVPGTAATVLNHVFRFADGGIFFIGSPNFNGFILYFELWGTIVTDFSVSYALGTLEILWPCDFSHYYDGACQPCLSSCSIGCVRGTSCYICDDFLCAQCSSFASGSCTLCIPNASGTPCACNAGFYQPTSQALCSACFTGCDSCTGTSYYLCTSCSPSYFFYNSELCVVNCPSGYTENTDTKSCDFISNIGLSLSLYDKIQLGSISGVTIGNSMSNYYPSYDLNDPYPAYLRGYYFTGTTYMSTNTVIGPYFTISIWIYPTGAGAIVAKTVYGNELFCLEILSSGYLRLSLILKDSSPISVTLSENALNGNWNFIAFTEKIDLSYSVTVNSYFNSLTKEAATSSNISYFQDHIMSTLYIGTKDILCSGFIGFLYNLNIFNTETLQYSDYTTSSCVSPCTSCPSDHNCLNACPITQYFDGSACRDCMSCPKGCRYTDTCDLCKAKQCYECDTFSGDCLNSVTSTETDRHGRWLCTANEFLESITNSCEPCDALCSVCKQTTYFECNACNGGKQIDGVICVSDCPYGYRSSCLPVTAPVIDQPFDTDFQGSYGIFTTGTDSSKYQHFASPETIDPIPAYNRGLYFDESMYLLSSVSVYLSHSFSMGVWIYVITNGDLLQKQTGLSLASTGAITASMEDSTQAASTESLSPTSSFTSWAYLSFTIYYTSNASIISLYINGLPAGSATIPGKIFRDQVSTNLQLGKSNISGFIGFIYYFQLWNTQITNFSTIISSFTFCGLGQGASCLSVCSISSYYDGTSCSLCSSCTKGCVRASTCNICDDLLCSVCSGFGAGKCITCVTNASKNPIDCACDPGYKVSADWFSCIMCLGVSALCTPASCGTSLYFFASTGQCLSECPSGYSSNSSTHTCDHISDLALSLELIDQIRLDTVSGFNVGSSNTNIYPDWNGILVTKYTTAGILKIFYQYPGWPSLTVITNDGSSYTFRMSPNVSNHWNYLVYAGEVQADGKSKFILYWNTGVNNLLITPSPSYLKDAHSGTLYIGNDETLGNSGMKGFVVLIKIYNSSSHLSDNYSAFCSCYTCPSDSQCLSLCDTNNYPDSCSACLTGCSKGCVSNLACTLCRDKECYSCTTFSGECTACIANAYKVAGHCMCLSNAVWVSSSQSCELCHSTCSTCSSPKYTECLTCVTGNYMIQSVCHAFCPIGYVINGNNCDSDPTHTNFFVFDLKPHQIKDIVTDLKSNIPVLTGIDNKFYPNYDATDPIATIYRGYYFTGSSYMQLPPYSGAASPLLTLAPKFVISTWIKPISGTGAIFCKQSNSGGFEQYINFRLMSKFPSLSLILRDSTPKTYTATSTSLEAALSQWNFISAVSDISVTPKQIIKLTKNADTQSSGDMHSSWLNDLQNSFYITIGACHADSTAFTSFFNGFLWDLKIYNTIVASPLTSSTCNGCSLCPIDNSNNCLDSCLIDSYWTGSICELCSTDCAAKGCARVDNNCNLCQDIICDICDYSNVCITCRAHASLVGSSCQCNTGYYWDISNESCELCDISCGACTSSGALDCSTCATGYYMALGICKAGCPPGHYLTVSGCTLAKEKIFDLDLNTLKGVIYDKASSIPVVTGSTKQFYPNYEADDPIPAYLRGFWFNGSSSLLRLPGYSIYTSPRLVISSTFTISIWLNTETSYSALLSKHIISDNYSNLYSITLMSSKPTIFLIIDSSPFYFIAQKPVNNYEWSHVVFTSEDAEGGRNTISCYINGVLDSFGITGSGSFADFGPQTTMSIGAQIGSTAIYNYYQGFIYTIQIFSIIKPISAFSTIACTESCSVCPISQICIPNCKINEYWSGPGYNICYYCNIKCTKNCRNWRSTCSLCDNLLCETCNDYSSLGCLACKENAINTDSCVCDENYVPDSATNSACITLPSGGYKGPDGYFYACPSLCSVCQSSAKCTACVDNASLINDLCYCSLGYNGMETCSLVSFSAKLTAMSDNSLYLTFSDSLASNLTASDFTIAIENQGKVSFTIEAMNSTCYYISLRIKEKISKGTLAILQFLDLNDVRSISNGILNSSELSAALNSYNPEQTLPILEEAGVQVIVAIIASLSFINPSSSSLWSMINCLEYLSYLTISGIPLSVNIRGFLNALNSFNLFPNIFPLFIDENEGNTPYSEAKEFGYSSDLILITTGNYFTMLLASILFLPIILYFSRCSHRWIGKKFMKTVKDYHFSFYLRWLIQCYLGLGAAACIGLLTFEFKNPTQLSNVIICLIICIFSVITPPAFFLFSYKNKNRIQSREKSFTSLFSSFFYEFKTDRGFLATQYYFVFFIRRFIYVINLVYLRDYPETEMTINIILSLMTVMHLWYFWPFEDKILQLCNLLTEVLICLVMGAISIYLFNLEQNVVSAMQYAIAAIIIVIIAVQLVSSIAIFIRTLYEMIRNNLEKAGMIEKSTHQPKNSNKSTRSKYLL